MAPNGENLVVLMRHSDLVLKTVMSLADRQYLVVAVGLAGLRRQLVDTAAAIDGLPPTCGQASPWLGSSVRAIFRQTRALTHRRA